MSDVPYRRQWPYDFAPARGSAACFYSFGGVLKPKAPWQMTLAEFGKAYKPIRYFQRYTPEQRADRAASFRLGPVQRDQVGEYCYVHPLRPDCAYPSPSRARRATHWHLIEQALRQGLPVPATVLGDYPPLLWKDFIQ